MGFDINIEMILSLCVTTGKPYYLSRASNEYHYTPPSVTIPEHLRLYLSGRGKYFHAYTYDLELAEMGHSVGAETFLEKYPSWETVLEFIDNQDDLQGEESDCGWMEEDHDGFKELLTWCVNQDVFFRVSWSY